MLVFDHVHHMPVVSTVLYDTRHFNTFSLIRAFVLFDTAKEPTGVNMSVF